MLRAILNKSRRQHLTKQQLYGHLLPITKTIQVRRTRHAVHCRRSRDELISNILQWSSSHGRAQAGRPGRTYIQQLWADTGCSLEDQRCTIEKVGGRGSGEIRAYGATWWWWWWKADLISQRPTDCLFSGISTSLCYLMPNPSF